MLNASLILNSKRYYKTTIHSFVIFKLLFTFISTIYHHDYDHDHDHDDEIVLNIAI